RPQLDAGAPVCDDVPPAQPELSPVVPSSSLRWLINDCSPTSPTSTVYSEDDELLAWKRANAPPPPPEPPLLPGVPSTPRAPPPMMYTSMLTASSGTVSF